MIAFPCAKINLGLRIIRKRPDGYHDLETAFVKIPLRDALEVLPSDCLLWDGAEDFPEDNLVAKAYRALQRLRPGVPPARFILRKKIPSGAGLGGGSSDASTALLLLDELFDLRLSEDELHRTARSLGADCPFFLKDEPQYAEGIGDLLTPVSLPLGGLKLTLVFPELFISTREAYSSVTPREPEESLIETLRRPIEEWRATLKNDFEASLFPKYPLLSEIKETLYRNGALYASMSGSGSTMYALSRQALNLPNDYKHQTFSLK